MATVGPSYRYEEDNGSDDEMDMSSADEEELSNVEEIETDIDQGMFDGFRSESFTTGWERVVGSVLA